MKILIIILLISLISHSLCARILGVFPVPSKSHQNVFDKLILELEKRGHEVVMVTVFPLLEPPKNLTQIDVSFTGTELRKRMKYADHSETKGGEFVINYMKIFLPIFEMQLETLGVKKILEDKAEKFDLLILPSYQIASAFMHRFPGVPVINFASLPNEFETVGAPTHPILYPEFFCEHLYDLTLWQKVETVYDFLNYRYNLWLIAKEGTERMRKYFGEDLPSVQTLCSKADLFFISGNHLLAGVRPLVPAIIYTDRLHLEKQKPLQKELQEFLDDSTSGVIYMSLGSNVKSKDLSNDTLNVFKETFAELPFRVMWKFEADALPGLPKNVLISKWFPQQDIFAHKNIKAFIFQGGLQSFEEAIRNSIPLICIPFAADQKMNAKKIARKGLGLHVDFATMTKDILKKAIISVAADQTYKNNMKKLSELIADEPSTPMERAVWWTEYLLRHKTASHLRSPALDASYTEFFMLDVIGFIVGLFILIAVTFIATTKIVLRKLVAPKPKLKTK